jgi:co-chaperonin GroES (HSP10)
MRVLGKKIVVEQHLSDTQTPGGLALPDTMQTRLPIGTVIAVGPEAGVIPGQVIQFNGYAGSPVSVAGKTYAVIDSDDILVIMEATDQ